MKYFLTSILFILVATANSFATTTRYCNCYHNDDTGMIIVTNYDANGALMSSIWGDMGNWAAKPLSYEVISNEPDKSMLIEKYLKKDFVLEHEEIASVEIVTRVKNPTTKKERKAYLFFNAHGGLIAMSDQWADNIRDCEGTVDGLMSFCYMN